MAFESKQFESLHIDIKKGEFLLNGENIGSVSSLELEFNRGIWSLFVGKAELYEQVEPDGELERKKLMSLMKEISENFNLELKREDVKELIAVIDAELDKCIKKVRNAVYGHEVRTFVTEYEELMLKKADLIAWEFLKKEKEGYENSEESPQACCRDCNSQN